MALQSPGFRSPVVLPAMSAEVQGLQGKSFFVQKFYRKSHFLEIKLFTRAQKSQFRKETWELMSCKSEPERKLPKSCQPCGYSPQLEKGPKSSSSSFSFL